MIHIDEQTVKNMIATLDGVEVRGAGNMTRILGCIRALQNALTESEKQEQAGE